MSRLRRLFFGFFEYIPVLRWCFALFVISFIAVVSVCKYIDLADTAVFSSFEILFLTLSDIINIVFIYLPLYLFIVCGVLQDDCFEAMAIVRFKSRREWLMAKAVTYFMNTAAFFLAVFVINYTVFSCVFNFSRFWSEDFVGFRVMMGQPAADFSSEPVITVGFACFAMFLYYLFCGTVNMLVSLFWGDEGVSLIISLVFGILTGLINMTALPADVTSQVIRSAVFIILLAAFYFLASLLVSKRDMSRKRKK